MASEHEELFLFSLFLLSLSDGFGGLQKYISNDKLFHFIMEKNKFSKDLFWAFRTWAVGCVLRFLAFPLVEVDVKCVQSQRGQEEGKLAMAGPSDMNELGTWEWALPGLRGQG